MKVRVLLLACQFMLLQLNDAEIISEQTFVLIHGHDMRLHILQIFEVMFEIVFDVTDCQMSNCGSFTGETWETHAAGRPRECN